MYRTLWHVECCQTPTFVLGSLVLLRAYGPVPISCAWRYQRRPTAILHYRTTLRAPLACATPACTGPTTSFCWEKVGFGVGAATFLLLVRAALFPSLAVPPGRRARDLLATASRSAWSAIQTYAPSVAPCSFMISWLQLGRCDGCVPSVSIMMEY